MAGERIHALTEAKHPTTAIDGVTHAAIVPSTVPSRDPGGAGSPGVAETMVNDSGVDVILWGMDYAALLALIGAAAANLVLGIKGQAGAAETITVKNVYFDSVPAQIDLKAKDAGGKVPTCAVKGTGQWGASDTLATMIAAG